MSKRLLWVIPILCLAAAGSAGEYASARKKIDSIRGDQLAAGTRVQFTPQELKAYAEHEMPPGVRNARLEIVSPGVATGSALIDFGKVRRAQGKPPGWLMSKLLDGERPVSVTARITSGSGRATVDVQQVRISGIEIDGGTLDFLIEHVLLPLYPQAAVNRPFELSHRVDRFDVQPKSVAVVIGR